MAEQKNYSKVTMINPFTEKLLNLNTGKNFVDRLFNSLLDDIEQMIDIVRNGDYDDYSNFAFALEFYRIILENLCCDTQAFRSLKNVQNIILDKMEQI
jgi:hypothetical protein